MKLTPSELLFVDRALRSLTQRQASKKWQTTFWSYRSWEQNPNSVPHEVRSALAYLNEQEIPKPLAYVVMRRREGMTQADLGQELGVSRQWVNRMELGDEEDDLLNEYWGDV